jgi:hypothetical protein
MNVSISLYAPREGEVLPVAPTAIISLASPPLTSPDDPGYLSSAMTN